LVLLSAYQPGADFSKIRIEPNFYNLISPALATMQRIGISLGEGNVPSWDVNEKLQGNTPTVGHSWESGANLMSQDQPF
jgi:hypothetical protein